VNSNPDISNPEGIYAVWICGNENGLTPKEKLKPFGNIEEWE
jgi:hypothetical protein